jgi:hypothetical protein
MFEKVETLDTQINKRREGVNDATIYTPFGREEEGTNMPEVVKYLGTEAEEHGTIISCFGICNLSLRI